MSLKYCYVLVRLSRRGGREEGWREREIREGLGKGQERRGRREETRGGVEALETEGEGSKTKWERTKG